MLHMLEQQSRPIGLEILAQWCIGREGLQLIRIMQQLWGRKLRLKGNSVAALQAAELYEDV